MWAHLAKPRRRLDLTLVELCLADSRTQAQALIDDRNVLVNGAVATKYATKVSLSDQVNLTVPKPRYVSRAGLKLEHAIAAGWLDPTGLMCLDAGSSTGGFTDCLLQYGAEHVTAVDVGTNQLHEKLRSHPKVSLHEQTDIRKFDSPQRFDLVVADLSFISISSVIEYLVALAKTGAKVVLLIKPQFEAGRQVVSKGGGVVSDPDVWLSVIRLRVFECLQLGLTFDAISASPIKGVSGNVEFVVAFTKADVV